MVQHLRERVAQRLRSLVAPAAAAAPEGRGHVLAIASNKGGVGKTTSAVNLAAALARRGVATLLVDLDPQGHVGAALHLQAPADGGSLSDVLLGRRRDVADICFASRWPRLCVTPSDKGLAETEMVLGAKIGKEHILRGALGGVRARFEAIVLDCPPNAGTLTLNALCAADSLLVPADMSVLALEGVADILACVETLRQRLGRAPQLAGIVATRFDRRSSQANEATLRGFAELCGEALLRTRIPQAAALNRAHMAGRPIFEHAAGSPGARAYSALASELLPRLGHAAGAAAAAADAAAADGRGGRARPQAAAGGRAACAARTRSASASGDTATSAVPLAPKCP